MDKDKIAYKAQVTVKGKRHTLDGSAMPDSPVGYFLEKWDQVVLSRGEDTAVYTRVYPLNPPLLSPDQLISALDKILTDTSTSEKE